MQKPSPTKSESSEERRERVREEASQWLERIERTLHADECDRLREWLQTSLHREIIVERCALWHGPEVLAVLGAIIPIDYESPDVVSDRHASKVVFAMLAVSLCFIVVAIVRTFGNAPYSSSGGEGSLRMDELFRTAVDSHREVKLPDGSTMVLNTATRAYVNFGLRSRDANLIAGEATFSVVKESRRPFRVSAGLRNFVSQGGRFNLRQLAPDRVELTVIEGEVTIEHPFASVSRTPAQRRDEVGHSHGAATLYALDAAIVGSDWQSISHLQQNEAQARLSWQRGPVSVGGAQL